MNASVLRTHDRIDRMGLKQFMQSLGPDCPRAKGFLGLQDGSFVSFQSVYDQLEIREIEDYVGPSELILFGEKLTADDIRRRFKAWIQPGNSQRAIAN